jgi:hypothetical protein
MLRLTDECLDLIVREARTHSYWHEGLDVSNSADITL